MAIEFLTRISWVSNLQGPGIWAWIPGRFRQERLKSAPWGINKTTRTWAWAVANSASNVSLHSPSPPLGESARISPPLSSNPLFLIFFTISCGCNVLEWNPSSVTPSSFLLRVFAARAAFQQCDLKPYPSKFMKYLASVRVDLRTFTFYLSARQLPSPFPPLRLAGSGGVLISTESQKGVQHSSMAKCSLSTPFPCCVSHPGLTLELLDSISGSSDGFAD